MHQAYRETQHRSHIATGALKESSKAELSRQSTHIAHYSSRRAPLKGMSTAATMDATQIRGSDHGIPTTRQAGYDNHKRTM